MNYDLNYQIHVLTQISRRCGININFSCSIYFSFHIDEFILTQTEMSQHSEHSIKCEMWRKLIFNLENGFKATVIIVIANQNSNFPNRKCQALMTQFQPIRDDTTKSKQKLYYTQPCNLMLMLCLCMFLNFRWFYNLKLL